LWLLLICRSELVDFFFFKIFHWFLFSLLLLLESSSSQVWLLTVALVTLPDIWDRFNIFHLFSTFPIVKSLSPED
jgi:hypothetical protein